MTTDRARASTTRAPAARHLRAYVGAALAAAYAALWWRLGAPAPARAERVPAVTSPAPPPPRAVWLDELPTAARPAVTVPAGWHVVGAAPAARVDVARRPPRAAPARTGRVRTRSS